jgi:hypothetical protein
VAQATDMLSVLLVGRFYRGPYDGALAIVHGAVFVVCWVQWYFDTRWMSQKQAQVEPGSTKVQVVEIAPTGRHFLQTLLSLSISLFSMYKG